MRTPRRDGLRRNSSPAGKSRQPVQHNTIGLIQLQQRAGNRATAQLLQGDAAGPREGATDGQDPEHLDAPELAGEEFDAGYHNRPPLGVGDSRTRAVASLQTLLAGKFGLGVVMPRTFASGQADGRWGDETTAAVRDFQAEHGVRPVGGFEAGHKTLLALDRALAGSRPPPTPVATPEIRLEPSVGPEAGPRQQLGHIPYRIRVVGTGFQPATPLLLSFEAQAPVHAVATADGTVLRSLEAARRVQGTYRVTARGLTVETAAEFRVIPAQAASPDPRREKAYARFLREATRMLRAASFGTPLSSDFDHDRFDTEFWEWVSDPKYNRVLQLKAGKTPSQGIDALFDRLTAWNVDCDHTVQIANLSATRKTLGSALFDQRQGLQMHLRSRESDALTTRLHFGRTGPTAAWRIVHDFVPPDKFVFAEGPPTAFSTESVVASAPPGSRVRWTNILAAANDSFHHENAVKLADDQYAASGFDDPLTGNEFTRDALEIRLALKTAKRPTRADIRQTIYIDEVEIFDRP